MFKCKDCARVFDSPDTVTETHGFKEPPYESFQVCPHCKSTRFSTYDTTIPKLKIAEDLLSVLCNLNVFRNSLEGVFGGNFENKNLDDSISQITDMIFEMYPYSDMETDKLIYSLTEEKDIKPILIELEENA